MAKKDEKLLKEILANIQIDIEADADNQKMMLDDLKFCSLNQWPDELRNARENDPNGERPCLTIDQSNQYITQVVNDVRQNRPGIKTSPDDDEAHIETAKAFQGIIRKIEDKSSAYIAYETAVEWAASTGRGYFRIITEYIEGSFDQEPRIKHIPDALSVYLSAHTMPDGSDAIRATIIEEIPVDEFKRLNPDAKHESADFGGIDNVYLWRKDKTITVAEHFYFEYQEKELFFLADGTTLYSDEFDGAEENIVKRRKENVKKVKWCKLSGAEILEEGDWAGIHIPVIEVIGKEAVIGGKRILRGLVRPIKDNLRMYNYWASAITEKIALSPKTPFIGAVGQFATKGDQWGRANKENFAYLEYDPVDVNGNAIPAPQRVQASPIEAAMHQMMGIIKEDTRAALGMYKASVGDSSSQQSGRALLALQRESDTGTFHYSDNLARSLCYAGRQLVDIIPKYMDTRRVVQILGDDDETKSIVIDPSQKESFRQIQTPDGVKKIYNLAVGKFGVSVTVGPSYNTKRMEAATVFTDLARSATDPGSAAVMNYLAIKNSDVTSSDEAIVMLKSLLPPPALQAEEQGPVPPQVMAEMQKMQQQGAMMQEQLRKLEQENIQLEAGTRTDMAKLSFENNLKLQELDLERKVEAEKAGLAREKFEFEKQLEIEKADHEIILANKKAAAENNIKIEKLNFDQKVREQDFVAQNEQNSEKLMPQLLQRMDNQNVAMTEVFTNILAVMQGIQTTLDKPKKVSIGKVQKDSDGNIVGATVNTTVQ